MNVQEEYERARSGNKPYKDGQFRLSDSKNNYGNTEEQIIHVLKELQNSDKSFVDTAGPDDIAQGEAGDCWFLSSLCSFVNERKELGNQFLNS